MLFSRKCVFSCDFVTFLLEEIAAKIGFLNVDPIAIGFRNNNNENNAKSYLKLKC